MTRILITGSVDGLGLLAGRLLVRQGHRVTLHARDTRRAADARAALPDAEGVLVGDLLSIRGALDVAAQANDTGRFGAVIHNAGIGYREPRRMVTDDGLCHVFAVNVLAPYVLTAAITPPQRLVYLSSVLAGDGTPSLADAQWQDRVWNGRQAYSDSKLFDALLAFAVARHWPDVRSNSVEPGWVPTRMGGPDATDDLALAPVTQAWLAAGDDPATAVTGRHFYHQRERVPHPEVHRSDLQDELLAYCAELSGIELPRAA